MAGHHLLRACGLRAHRKMTTMKPKARRAMKLLDSFHAGVPDVIETMMSESGMMRDGMAGIAARIRGQVNDYVSSISRSGDALAPREAESVRVLITVLVAAAKERQFAEAMRFRISSFVSLN